MRLKPQGEGHRQRPGEVSRPGSLSQQRPQGLASSMVSDRQPPE